MIVIRTIEELEAERERQLKAWIKAGKKDRKFYLSLEKADLSRADLTGADLIGADLTGADLTEADLSRADLSWANLSGANLKKANLSGADSTGADLKGADLRGANLSFANLTEANLIWKDWNFSIIKDAIITQSQYDYLLRMYSHEFMAGFIIKDMEVTQ